MDRSGGTGGIRPVRWSPAALLALPLALMLAALLLWPLILLVGQSFSGTDAGGNGGDPWHRAWNDLFTTPRYLRALGASVGLSAAVAVVATALCLGPAWLLARHDFPGRRLLRGVLALPMAFSGLIVGFLMVLLFGRVGVVPQLAERWTGEPVGAGLAYTFAGLFVAYLWFEIPRATLTLEAGLRTLDPRLEAAAASLGAGAWQRLRLVVLPQLAPALAGTLALTFAVSLGSFGVALILAVRGVALLPLELFNQYLAPPTDRPLAAAMALTLGTIALGVGLGLKRLVRAREVA